MRVWDSFKETPSMSTYIVAFVVSDLKNVSFHDGKNTVRLRKDVFFKVNMPYPLHKSIMLLEIYTEIMYGLPKFDEMAVPNLHFLAMENWGIGTEK